MVALKLIKEQSAKDSLPKSNMKYVLRKSLELQLGKGKPPSPIFYRLLFTHSGQTTSKFLFFKEEKGIVYWVKKQGIFWKTFKESGRDKLLEGFGVCCSQFFKKGHMHISKLSTLPEIFLPGHESPNTEVSLTWLDDLCQEKSPFITTYQCFPHILKTKKHKNHALYRKDDPILERPCLVFQM